MRNLQITFSRDVIENSTKSAIKMSPRMANLMHELRNINNRRIVNYAVLQEDAEVYPASIRTLMNRFADVIQENGMMDMLLYNNGDYAKALMEKYEGTPDADFIRYMVNSRPEEHEFINRMLKEATANAIKDEQETARQVVLGKKKFKKEKGYENRDARIQAYIDYYNAKGITEEYSEEDIQKDIEVEMNRRLNSNDESVMPFDRKVALEYGARYISTLNDIEFFDLIRNTGLINDEQARSLRRTYREIGPEGLRREVHETKEFKAISEEQARGTEKMTFLSPKSGER